MATLRSIRAGLARSVVWRTTPAERAFFSEGYMGYVAVLVTLALFTIELTANISRESGAIALLHLLFVGSLYLFLVVVLLRAVGRAIGRRRD